MTKHTINDYIAQVKALRDLGQELINDQYYNQTGLAPWVDEVEVMDDHLACCLFALAGDKRKAMIDKVARMYGSTHIKTVRFAALCEHYYHTEQHERMLQDEYKALMDKGPFIDE